MRKLCKLTALAVIMFIILTAFPAISQAAMEKSYLTTLNEAEDLVIMVEWETEEPIVRFISPGGVTYDPTVETDGTQTSRGGQTMFYFIADAQAGEWYVEYDKLTNETIYMSVIENTGVFAVESVTAVMNNDNCEVKFSVYSEKEQRFSYTVYLSAKEGVMGEEVASGSGYTGKDITERFNMSRYGSGDTYRVYVYAYYTDGDIDVYDGAYSGAFSYTNKNEKQTETAGLGLYVYPLEYTSELRFDADSYYEYLAAFYEKKVREEGKAAAYGDEPDYMVTVSGQYGANALPFVYNDSDELSVRFSERRRGDVYSTPRDFSVSIAKLPMIEFENVEVTNKQTIDAKFSGFPKDAVVTVSNGIGTTSLYIDGDKTLEIEIPEYSATVTVKMEYAEGVYLIYEKEIYRDTTPPAIYMAEDYSDVYTDMDSYIIIGTLTDAASFTIGGQPVEITPNGDFSYEAKLAPGVNILEAVASDGIGNAATYKMKITKSGGVTDTVAKDDSDTEVGPKSLLSIVRSSSGIWRYSIGILAAAAALVIGIFATVTWRKKPSALMSVHHIFASLMVISALSALYHGARYAVFALYNNKFTFIEAVSQSVFDGYRLLSLESKYLMVALISAAVLVGSAIVIAVTMYVVRPLVNKHKAKKDR